MRIDRFLANMGCGSRTEVKQLIKSGKVKVNGKTVIDPGHQVQPEDDRIDLKGDRIVYREFLYLMMNKPAGVISATEDSKEQTVLDLIESKYHNKGLFPVGRLDKDTEGLLILTNHGELGHQLLSPKKHVYKKYLARIDGKVTGQDQVAFKSGIELDDGYLTLPGDLEIISSGPVSEVIVKIREGKFHQIKRMFQALEKRVVYLKRISMGGLILDPGLNPGEYRELTDGEVKQLSENQ